MNRTQEVLVLNLEIGFFLDLIFVGLVKLLLKRPRPTYADDKYNTPIKIDSYSFPSGHTSRCMFIASFGVLSFAIFQDYFIITYIIIWSLLTSLSRVLLGRHYISDVVGGTSVALFTTYLVTSFSYL